MVADKEYEIDCEVDRFSSVKTTTDSVVVVANERNNNQDHDNLINPTYRPTTDHTSSTGNTFVTTITTSATTVAGTTRTKRKKNKKKKIKNQRTEGELGEDDDDLVLSSNTITTKGHVENIVVGINDITETSGNDGTQAVSSSSSSSSMVVVVPRQPSKKPIQQRGLLPSAYIDEFVKYGQTDPPTIPVKLLFQQESIQGQEQSIPCGEIQYDRDRTDHQMKRIYGNRHTAAGTSYRVTPQEEMITAQLVTANEMNASVIATEWDWMNDVYTKLRLGGEIHRQVRQYTQSIIRPGIVLSDMCTQLENMNRSLTQEAGILRGIAFPTGCSINHVAAHYTPNTGDNTILRYHDVMKVDFGVQIDGYIIDSAWTVAFDEVYDPLLQAVREATEMGIATAGIDQRLCDIGTNIQEVMESYEVEIQNRIYPIRPIRNLAGHSIDRYQIHGTKSVPIVKNGCDESIIMEEYELYAIETFGSTGRGYVVEDMECSHYMKRFDAPYVPLRMASSKKLLHHIDKTFGTLAFCRRWLDRADGGSTYVHGTNGQQVKYMGALKNLCDVGIIQPIPPLCDVPGCYTAQYEHTFMIQPNGKKEIFSRGNDY